jgi:hypothetical protein
VNRPTRFLAGESGPERVDVTPAGQMASSGGLAVNVSVQVDASSVPSAHRQQFIEAVGEEVSRTLMPGGRNYRNLRRAMRSAAMMDR